MITLISQTETRSITSDNSTFFTLVTKPNSFYTVEVHVVNSVGIGNAASGTIVGKSAIAMYVAIILLLILLMWPKPVKKTPLSEILDLSLLTENKSFEGSEETCS